jgi:hypothetical protein
MVCVREYPQLQALLWNSRQTNVEPNTAFALYERNWRWIDADKISATEGALIERLKNEFGAGLLNV